MKQSTEIIFCKPLKVEKTVSYFLSVKALEYTASLTTDLFLIIVMNNMLSLIKIDLLKTFNPHNLVSFTALNQDYFQ